MKVNPRKYANTIIKVIMLVIKFMNRVEQKFLFLQRTKLVAVSFYSIFYFSGDAPGFLIK